MLHFLIFLLDCSFFFLYLPLNFVLWVNGLSTPSRSWLLLWRKDFVFASFFLTLPFFLMFLWLVFSLFLLLRYMYSCSLVTFLLTKYIAKGISVHLKYLLLCYMLLLLFRAVEHSCDFFGITDQLCNVLVCDTTYSLF